LLVARGVVQRGMRERGRAVHFEPGGDGGQAFVDAEILGHVARRVRFDDAQCRRAAQHDAAHAHANRRFLFSARLRQHERLEGRPVDRALQSGQEAFERVRCVHGAASVRSADCP